MTNGLHGVQVPNLAALGNPDPAAWMQQTILRAAGITKGATGVVLTDAGEIVLNGIDIIIMAMPPEIHIVSVIGRTMVGPTVIPWHAVRSLSAA